MNFLTKTLMVVVTIITLFISQVSLTEAQNGGCYYNQNGQLVCPRYNPGPRYNGAYTPYGMQQAPWWMPLQRERTYSQGYYYTPNYFGGNTQHFGRVYIGRPYTNWSRDAWGNYNYQPNRRYWYYGGN